MRVIPARKKKQKKKVNSYTVNRKLVDGVNAIGQGYAALERMCMVLNMHCMSSRSFYNNLDTLSKEVNDLENKVLETARNEVREAYLVINPELSNDTVLDIAGSYDGTWQKRGFTSLYGVGIIIDLLTGLVLDFEICSKYCAQCEVAKKRFGNDNEAFSSWHVDHVKKDCNITYAGSSGSMEVEAAERIWTRSVAKNQMRYTKMVSDGDSKTWARLNEISPYGNIVVQKEECINHVHKRLGTGLRNIAKKKRLGGKTPGSLKQNTIVKLQSYYRQAIIRNRPDVPNMQTAIQATLDHCSSTDKKPKHSNCPTGNCNIF